MKIKTCSKHEYTGTSSCPDCVMEKPTIPLGREIQKEVIANAVNQAIEAALKKQRERIKKVVEAHTSTLKVMIGYDTPSEESSGVIDLGRVLKAIDEV